MLALSCINVHVICTKKLGVKKSMIITRMTKIMGGLDLFERDYSSCYVWYSWRAHFPVCWSVREPWGEGLVLFGCLIAGRRGGKAKGGISSFYASSSNFV